VRPRGQLGDLGMKQTKWHFEVGALGLTWAMGGAPPTSVWLPPLRSPPFFSSLFMSVHPHCYIICARSLSDR
jgi:hypothetical protein